MLIDVGLLLLGGIMLYFGAEWLVRGAAGLANAFGVRPLLIGLTVVSYGTSAPELAVSLLAAYRGSTDITLGNVVGSNVANMGLILGLTALVAPPAVDGSLIRRELPVLILATVALPVLLLDGMLGRIDAGLMLLGAIAFSYGCIRWSRESEESDVDEIPETTKKLPLAALVTLGLAVLIGGGEAFVRGAVSIARQLGVSERTVGLTVVALGTSPRLSCIS